MLFKNNYKLSGKSNLIHYIHLMLIVNTHMTDKIASIVFFIYIYTSPYCKVPTPITMNTSFYLNNVFSISNIIIICFYTPILNIECQTVYIFFIYQPLFMTEKRDLELTSQSHFLQGHLFVRGWEDENSIVKATFPKTLEWCYEK